uniref:Antitermination protein n=1 Tax=Strongyloides venezuelensis TaxID=75913 RepID=A0A0K0FBW7_STRVS
MKNLKRKDLNYTILSELIRFEINDLCLKRTNVIIGKAIKESRSMKYVCEEISRKKFNNISKESVNKIFGKEREENIEWRNYVKKNSIWHPITPDEVSFRIKKSKRKACGADGIFSKHPILGGRKAAEALANLFNNHGYLIPNQMNELNHSWLLYSLAINDFDEELVKRIEALYRSPKATFSTGINNSNTTIEVKSGIRQSDH